MPGPLRLNRFLANTLLICVLLPLACGKKEAIPPDVIARVGERNVTLEDFKRYLDRNAGTDLGQIEPEASSALLDQFLEEALLSEYALAHGIDVPADRIASAVRNDPGSTVIEKRDEMRRLEILGRIRSQAKPPSDQDIRDYYEAHPQEFDLAERVQARQVLFHDEKLAEEIRNRLLKGASFAEISSEYSQAPNAKEGGDIGFVGRGQLPKVFEDELFSVSPGSISRVIRTDNSFHIFKVDALRPAGKLPFEEARPIIDVRLLEAAIEGEVSRLVSDARKEIPLRILTKRLPFTYSGALLQWDDE